MPVRASRIVVAAVLLVAGAAPARRAHPFADAPIRFGAAVLPSLRTLWDSSVTTGAERVACLGGHVAGGITYITRVAPVEASADQMNASASTSLAQCRPPEWFGTVHTHIARYQGIPYVTFSGADRGVMRAWHVRWHDDGVFCVLYDERTAYCEAGDDRGGEVAYAAPADANMTP
jgi:hypothetical protein